MTTATRATASRAPSPPSPGAARSAGTATTSWWPLAVLMAGTFMVVLDFFVVNVAIPSLQHDLHATPTAVEWVVDGYGVAFAACLVAGARLGDRWGRRRMFAAGMGVFTIASAACGAAPDPASLIGARVAQGVGAALLGPAVLSLVGVLYPGERRARAISVYGIVMGGAAAAGQLIGGGLVQADIAGLGWRAVFLVNVPVGIAAVAVVGRLVPESRAPVAGRLDGIGMALVTAGLLALVLPLIQGRADGWPAWTWASLAAAPVLIAVFVAHQRTRHRGGSEPLIDLRLFSVRSFSAGLGAQVVLWCGQASFFLFFALFLQQGKGLDPLDAGAVFTILAGAYVAVSMRAPALTLRFGRRVLGVGALTMAAGHVALAVAVVATGARGPLIALVPGLLLVGAGMGACLTPLTVTVLASADAQRAGAVSGLLSTMQQVGNSVGVAVAGLVFYGLVSGGYRPAFIWTEVLLAGFVAGVAALSRLLPASA